jgi:hypothetical protein
MMPEDEDDVTTKDEADSVPSRENLHVDTWNMSRFGFLSFGFFLLILMYVYVYICVSSIQTHNNTTQHKHKHNHLSLFLTLQ